MTGIIIGNNIPIIGKKNDQPIVRSRPFSYDPLTGVRKEFHYHADGSWTISEKQDVEPIIDQNKAEANNIDTSQGWKGDLHKVASLPMAKYMELRQAGVLNDPIAFKKWLNDPDNKYYRTRAGRI